MLYPSIQELLTATAKDGEEKLNKYSVTMATAKCARMITNEYIEQRHIAEKKAANKEEKDVSALVNKDYRDEKAVKNALREMKDGKFEVYLPDEEGYENAIVDVVDYVEPKEEFKPFKQMMQEAKASLASDNFDDFDSKDLMDADEVFTDDAGYKVTDAEEIDSLEL